MGLVDIGEGVKIVNPEDVIPQKVQSGMDKFKDTLGVANALDQYQAFPAQQEKLNADIVKGKADAINAIGLLAVEGNTGGATALMGKLFPQTQGKVAVIQSPDPQERAKGIINVVDLESGKLLYAQDIFADKRINADINRRSDLIKKQVEIGWDRKVEEEKQVLDLTKQISKDQGIPISEARDIAIQTVQLSRTQDAEKLFGGGKKGIIKPLITLDKDQVEGVLKQKNVVNSATRRYGQASLREKKDLSPEQTDNFAATLETVNSISSDLIPGFQALANKSTALTQPGYLGGTVNNIKSKFGLQSPEYAYVKSLTDQTKWNKVVQVAGTTFTEKVANELKGMVPTEYDPIDIAVAKSAALISSTLALANNKLDVWDASGRYTGSLRNLVDPKGNSMYTQLAGIEGVLSELPVERQAIVAREIFSKLPSEVREDQQVMGTFIQSMPKPLQNAMIKEAGDRYEVPVGSSVEMARDILGINKK